jgi:hypothetical protein
LSAAFDCAGLKVKKSPERGPNLRQLLQMSTYPCRSWLASDGGHKITEKSEGPIASKPAPTKDQAG